jgi:hypothetical protein
MADVRLSPQAIEAYAQLEKAGATLLLDAVDDALDILKPIRETRAAAVGRSPAASGASRYVTGTTTG